jgi:hypothetical protein
MSGKQKMTAERAIAIVREAATTEGLYSQEVAALSVCVSAIEQLPEFSRGRVVDYLREMFKGSCSINLLTAVVEEMVAMKNAAEKNE